MKIIDHPYTNTDAEYNRINALLREIETYPEIDNNWDPARMDWWRYAVHAEKGVDFFQTNAHYWSTDTGQVVGLFITENGKSDFFIVLHPDHLALFSDVLNWGLDVWAQGKPKISTDVYTFGQWKIEQFLAAGFHEDGHVENVRVYPLAAFDFSYDLKTGFELLTFQTMETMRVRSGWLRMPLITHLLPKPACIHFRAPRTISQIWTW